ncbi:MAG: enoyl-CoA hydratase/isomerase family protein [Dehalococcoidia bacterium]
MTAQTEDLVLVERSGRIATITLNRPRKLNALNAMMVATATDVFKQFAEDRQTSVIVLRGAGKAFSAGADVTELRELNPETARAFITRLHELLQIIRELPQIVVAAVAGPCFGGACELAAACDIRIAAESARFGMPEIKVGLPSVIEAALLVPLMGLGRASDFVLTGEELNGAEAERVGLASRVVPDDELESKARELAERLAGYSGPALRLQKELVRGWFGTAYDAAIERGIDTLARAFTSSNPREALDAFLERREPRFADL